MKVGSVSYGHRQYGISKTQQEALYARNTTSSEDMLRIAKNSNNHLVLSNLALNPNLKEYPEVVEALFDTDNKSVHKRLENLGFEKGSFLSRLF